ncbi:hypothetical protein pb186bvf_017256 [Paramecium bursaria]
MLNTIIPIRLAIKYSPPSLGLIYKRNQRDKKKRRYHIQLNQLAYLNDPQEITEQLYSEHPEYINNSNVEYHQVLKLVTLLYEHIQSQKKSVIKNLDEVSSYIQSDDEHNKSILFETEQYKTPYKREQQPDSLKMSSSNLSLSMSGMQQFMQSQKTRFNKKSPTNEAFIQNFEDNQPAPRNSRYIDQMIDISQQNYYLKQNKHIQLPEQLLTKQRKY